MILQQLGDEWVETDVQDERDEREVRDKLRLTTSMVRAVGEQDTTTLHVGTARQRGMMMTMGEDTRRQTLCRSPDTVVAVYMKNSMLQEDRLS